MEYQEEILEAKLKEFAEKIRETAEETLGDLHCGLLPYVVDDSIMNAHVQVQDLLVNILAGRFEWDGDNYIAVNSAREFSPRVRIEFSSFQYDALRDRIIERMPKCPKDAKIKELEDRLEIAYNYR